MDDDGRFMAWFGPWRQARPDDTPIGWYSIDDLAAAFTAGAATKDDRPGKPVSPPQDAGPVPAQE